MKISRKLIIIVSLSFAAVLAASALIVKTHYNSIPDFSTKTPEQIEQYIRSEQFQKLDGPARMQVFEKIMVSNSKKYFEIPEEQRIAYLDKVIDIMEERRQEFRERSQQWQAGRNGPNIPSSPNDFRGQRRHRSDTHRSRDDRAVRGRARAEKVSPEDSARMRAFSVAMRMRMQQRGINTGPGRRP